MAGIVGVTGTAGATGAAGLAGAAAGGFTAGKAAWSKRRESSPDAVAYKANAEMSDFNIVLVESGN
jgi:sugar (pentulose or hexulose) kinase